jgi:hypothetical protein
MGLEFIDRTLRTSGCLLLGFFPFGIYYLGVYPALAVFSGGVWGILNLLFITALVRETIKPGAINKGKALGLAFLKIPLLYASLYALLKIPRFDPIHLMIGFSTTLVVMVLKIASRRLVPGVDRPRQESKARGTA